MKTEQKSNKYVAIEDEWESVDKPPKESISRYITSYQPIVNGPWHQNILNTMKAFQKAVINRY